MASPVTFLDQGDVIGEQWLDSQGGGAVVYYRLSERDHDWRGAMAGKLSTDKVIWQFFATHPLLAPVATDTRVGGALSASAR